jgi:hypothetical protein
MQAYLLLSDEVDNGHYNIVLPVEQEVLGTFDKMCFYWHPLPKTSL